MLRYIWQVTDSFKKRLLKSSSDDVVMAVWQLKLKEMQYFLPMDSQLCVAIYDGNMVPSQLVRVILRFRNQEMEASRLIADHQLKNPHVDSERESASFLARIFDSFSAKYRTDIDQLKDKLGDGWTDVLDHPNTAREFQISCLAKIRIVEEMVASGPSELGSYSRFKMTQ